MMYELKVHNEITIHHCKDDAEALLLLEPRAPNGRAAESANMARDLANGPRIPNGGRICRLVTVNGQVQRWQLRPPAHLMMHTEPGLRGDTAGWAHELDAKEATR
jgi:hypothetical protein